MHTGRSHQSLHSTLPLHTTHIFLPTEMKLSTLCNSSQTGISLLLSVLPRLACELTAHFPHTCQELQKEITWQHRNTHLGNAALTSFKGLSLNLFSRAAKSTHWRPLRSVFTQALHIKVLTVTLKLRLSGREITNWSSQCIRRDWWKLCICLHINRGAQDNQPKQQGAALRSASWTRPLCYTPVNWSYSKGNSTGDVVFLVSFLTVPKLVISNKLIKNKRIQFNLESDWGFFLEANIFSRRIIIRTTNSSTPSNVPVSVLIKYSCWLGYWQCRTSDIPHQRFSDKLPAVCAPLKRWSQILFADKRIWIRH